LSPEASAATARREELGVSTLELFFDLVFVFTITQLTSVLAAHPDGRGLLLGALLVVLAGCLALEARSPSRRRDHGLLSTTALMG
jgi:low temperature requirement protein LtrA